MTLGQREVRDYTFRGQINFNKNINKVHNITAIAGYELRQIVKDFKTNEYLGYDPQTLEYDPYALGILKQGVTGLGGTTVSYPLYSFSEWSDVGGNRLENSDYRYRSFYANANYTYDNRFDISGSIRLDKANYFGVKANLKQTPFWSVGTGWKISQESFFNSPFIDNLRLRLTYGENGNALTNATTTTTVKVGTNPRTMVTSASISMPANPYLKWETVKAFNLGVDFAMFNNRLSGSIEYYHKKSEDLLANAPINATYGYYNLFQNIGEMYNKGFDIMLQGKVGKEFKWKPMLNLSYNKNKVTKAEAPINNANIVTYQSPSSPMPGYDMNGDFAYRYAGLNKEGNPMVYIGQGSERQAVDYNTTVTDFDDVIYVGTKVAKVYGGFTNSISYKNFELSCLMTFKAGHIFIRPTYVDYAAGGVSEGRFYKDVVDRWKNPGDETTTTVPGIITPQTLYNRENMLYYTESDALIEDASHIRFKDIVLRYDVPSSVLTKSFVNKLSLSVEARNLGIIWRANSHGIDPDYIGVITPVRNYTLRLNLTF